MVMFFDIPRFLKKSLTFLFDISNNSAKEGIYSFPDIRQKLYSFPTHSYINPGIWLIFPAYNVIVVILSPQNYHTDACNPWLSSNKLQLD